MDDKTRERLLNQLRSYLLDVADHVVEYGCIGTVLVNQVADKAMAAIDEATAPQWTRVTPATMPPEYAPLFISFLNDGGRRIESRGYFGHQCHINRPDREVWYDLDAGRDVTHVTHWMLNELPPAPLDA